MRLTNSWKQFHGSLRFVNYPQCFSLPPFVTNLKRLHWNDCIDFSKSSASERGTSIERTQTTAVY